MPQDTISITINGNIETAGLPELCVLSDIDGNRTLRGTVAIADRFGVINQRDRTVGAQELLDTNPGQGAAISAAYTTLKTAFQNAMAARYGD